MDPLLRFLERDPVLGALPKARLREVAGLAIKRDLRKGEILATQGDLWPYFLCVTQGEIDALKISTEGRSLIVSTFPAGELFWGLAFFQEEAPMLVDLAAHTDAQVYLWSRQQLMPVFLENGRVSWELCRLMIRRMQRASEILEEMAFQPVAARLARLLLEHFNSAGAPAVARRLTLEEMAARVGSTSEMICRALARFADRKLIEVTRTEFVLSDRAGLTQVADLHEPH